MRIFFGNLKSYDHNGVPVVEIHREKSKKEFGETVGYEAIVDVFRLNKKMAALQW